MKQILILLVFVGLASAVDQQCTWGPSYWCTSLSNAQQCGAFQHCLTTVWKNQKLDQDNGEMCTYCTSVVSDVKNFISQKQTQDQIRQFMESACSIIPVSTMATQCKSMVDQYLPQILTMIEAELDPQVVCSLIGLCNGLEDSVQHRPIHNLHRVPILKVPQAEIEPVCGDCKKFMTDIKNMVTSATTEKQVEQMLENELCANLGPLADECKSLVETYVPELMELLTTQFDPTQLCSIMGFCGASEDTPRALLAKMRLAKSPLFKTGQALSGSTECELCKTVITEAQDMLKDKKTQAEIEEFLKTNVCAVLGAMKGACDESVDQYGPEIFALLQMEADPDKVCAALGLCTNYRGIFNAIQPVVMQPNAIEPNVPKAPTKKPVRASTQCVMCEFVMTQIDSMLQKNATEQEIQAALDKVCSFLPQTISKECTDFVDTYAPAILAILSQQLSPELVCQTIGLCASTEKVVPVSDSETCGVCETLMQYVDSLLTQNSTVQEIELLMEKVCNFLPKNLATQCDDIVEQYGGMIIQMLSQFADPKEVCTEIGLCSAKQANEVPMETIVPSKAVLLGANKCTYGPAYWCASQENAQKCGATSHCKKHVWKN